jgi:hypothetical protein
MPANAATPCGTAADQPLRHIVDMDNDFARALSFGTGAERAAAMGWMPLEALREF